MSLDPGQVLPALTALSRAVSIRALYPPHHPRMSEAVAEVVEQLASVLADRRRESVSLLVVGDEIIVDERPLRRSRSHLRPLQRAMIRGSVQHLALGPGLQPQEVLELVDALVGKVRPRSSPHVLVGQLEVAEIAGAAGLRSAPRAPLSEQAVERGHQSFQRFASGRQGSLAELDRLVWELMDGLAESSRSMLLLAPLKTFDEHTFVHSVNVALLTLAQARYLGIDGPVLHDIGLAALLHDVGKLSLPAPLLAKRGRLESEEEWQLFQQHPVIGALQLSGVEGVPALAALVAYEHHLRWDGLPSYPSVPMGRTPNLASQLTAVADTYDVIVASQDLAGTPAHQVALEVWRQRAGNWLDPFLAGNLVLLLAEQEPGAKGAECTEGAEGTEPDG